MCVREREREREALVHAWELYWDKSERNPLGRGAVLCVVAAAQSAVSRKEREERERERERERTATNAAKG